MSDSEEAKNPHKRKKRNDQDSRAKSATSKAVSVASVAQDTNEAFRQLRASSMPAQAFLNPMKNLDPFYGMRSLTEISRGMSETVASLSANPLRDMVKTLDSTREAVTLSKIAQNTSETLRGLSHNPMKDTLTQMKSMGQMTRASITANPIQGMMKNLDPLYEAKAVSKMAEEAASALRSLSANPVTGMMRGLDCWKQTNVVSRMSLGSAAVTALAANPFPTVAKMSEPVHNFKTVSQMMAKTSATWGALSSNPLKDIMKGLDSLYQVKAVSQMAREASAAMLGITVNPLRNVVKEFKAVSEMTRSIRDMQRSLVASPLSHSVNILNQLEQIRDSITGLPLASRTPAFGHVSFSDHLRVARSAFAGGSTAAVAQKAAFDMAVNISSEAVDAKSEKLFSKADLKEVVVAFHELLLAETSQQRIEVVSRFSDSKGFNFLLNVFIGILATYIFLSSMQLKKEFDIHSRSAPAIEYVMHSNDKPHIGIARREGGVRVYEKPDKRSAPVYRFIDGEFIALMWDRQKGWRKVAYEVDLGTMKALKVGWIQDSDYDRTSMPVKSLFLRLYVEQ